MCLDREGEDIFKIQNLIETLPELLNSFGSWKSSHRSTSAGDNIVHILARFITLYYSR